jgi:hypothetical protein
MTQTASPASVRLPLATAFLLVIGFTYSDDIVEFALDVVGWRFAGAGPYLVFAVDLLLALSTAVLTWRMRGRWFTKQWAWATAILTVTHLLLIVTAGLRAGLGTAPTLTINLLATGAFLAVMTLLLLSALGDEDGSTSSWVFPIVLGAIAAQLASALWYPVINVNSDCAGEVASWYFSDIGHITPVILLTLGLELNFLRRNPSEALSAGRRVAPLLTVVMLGISEILAFSMIVKAEMPQCGFAAVWHEYSSFVFTAQSLTTGLATLLWLLLSDQSDVHSVRRWNSL